MGTTAIVTSISRFAAAASRAIIAGRFGWLAVATPCCGYGGDDSS